MKKEDKKNNNKTKEIKSAQKNTEKKVNLKVFSEHKKQYDETKEKRIILGICFGIFTFITIFLLTVTYICVVYISKPYKDINNENNIKNIENATKTYKEEVNKIEEEIKKIEQEIEKLNKKIEEYNNIEKNINQKETEKNNLLEEINSLEKNIETYNKKIQNTENEIKKLNEKIK